MRGYYHTNAYLFIVPLWLTKAIPMGIIEKGLKIRHYDAIGDVSEWSNVPPC